MAMPSSTAMVLNSTPQPPCASMTFLARCPTSCRWTCPGTNCVKLLAIATMGFSKSASFMPVARQRARAPAMLRPWVEVRLRYPFMPERHPISAPQAQVSPNLEVASGRRDEERIGGRPEHGHGRADSVGPAQEVRFHHDEAISRIGARHGVLQDDAGSGG